jgi:hypothetical protein
MPLRIQMPLSQGIGPKTIFGFIQTEFTNKQKKDCLANRRKEVEALHPHSLNSVCATGSTTNRSKRSLENDDDKLDV